MPQQKITACAFIHKDGKLFLPRRAATKSFLPNKFELPGGHIEYREDIIEGLRREIREELSLEVIIGDPLFAFTYMNDSQHCHSIEVDYFVQFADPNPVIHLHPEDHSEYRWVTQAEAKELLGEDDDEYKAIKRGFEILEDKQR